MLKGMGSASEQADALSQQDGSSQPTGASQQPRENLWKDVPGFGAALLDSPSKEAGEAAGAQSGASLWQPRDPWRDEPIVTSDAADVAAGKEPARDVSVVNEAVRGFNNDPAAAGQVRSMLHQLSVRPSTCGPP